MAQNIIYHEARPMNDSTAFGEFESVDWEIEDVGRKLLKNSIYVEADLEVFSSTGVVNPTFSRIGVTRDIGFHSFYESWQVEAKSQNIQNIQHYPRYVNIVETGNGNISSCLTPMSQAEGKQISEEAARYVCQLSSCSHRTATNVILTKPANICIKPKICLNSMAGDDYSFSKNGAIRISTNLARNGSALHGRGVGATTSYRLSNMRLKYMTIPDDGKQSAIMMNSVVSVKQSINSQQANLSVKVPAQAVSGVVVTYIAQANEVGLATDSYKLEKLPLIDEIQYLFSDSQAKYISYNVTDQQDMVKMGVEALSNAGIKVKANSFKNNGDEGVVHGLDFQQSIDLSRQKFGLNLRSSSDKMNANPRSVYMHFLNVISL